MPRVLEPPPFTLVEPVTEVLHGVEITDPYRWLEDQDSPRTRKWIEEQTAYTRAYLDALPGRDLVRKRIQALLDAEVISDPYKIGSRYFFHKRGRSQEQPLIVMRDGIDGTETVLIDPVRRDGSSATRVGIAAISTDGHFLAYSVRDSGDDTAAVEILDVNSGRVLPDRLPRGQLRGMVFHPNGNGFFYVHDVSGGSRPHYRAAYWHAFGTEIDNDVEVFVAGEDPHLYLALATSQDCKYLGYIPFTVGDCPTTEVFLHDLEKGTSPRKIVNRHPGIFTPFFLGNELFALTDWEASNLRVVRINLDHPEPELWTDFVGQQATRIQSLGVAGGLLFVSYLDNLSTRIEVYDRSGRTAGVVACPPLSTVNLLTFQLESDSLFLGTTSYARAPEILCYHVPTGRQEVWFRSQVPIDPSAVVVEPVTISSKDGTEVPMLLVFRKEHRLRVRPTVLTAYGGFGAAVTPQFSAFATFLLEQGCLFAVANIRGGSEFGEQWHLAAKRSKRQNAIDDFIAAAQWLLDTGRTQPGKLAIAGGSNGGLLVGAALTQRPDLFRTVLCMGPVLDMLRYHKFDEAKIWIDEYGSPDDARDFASLIAYSPYHRVQDGTSYPAVLLISGDADTRCNPLHARKMAARLQAATTSAHPILLDYRPRWGHVPAQSLTERISALTDRLSFICHEIGVQIEGGFQFQ